MRLRPGLVIEQSGDIKSYNNQSLITASDQKEYVAYSNTRQRHNANLGAELFEDIVFKANDIKAFTDLIPLLELNGHEVILEIGAGQGWASTIIKQQYPGCYVVASDLVYDALAFVGNYEDLIRIELDEKWTFNCRDMPFEDDQFDKIFTFAAFHHLGDNNDFSSAVSEMLRVLKPGGKAYLLYEPSSPQYLYPFMYRLVNKRREVEGVDEDVLVPRALARLPEGLPCKVSVSYYPLSANRKSITALLYYGILSKFRFLAQFTVCTINVVIEKTGNA